MADEVAPIPNDMGSGDATDETSDDVSVWHAVDQPLGKPLFWIWLRHLLFRPPDVTQRLADLSAAINQRPQVAANYVLRGEVWLQAGEYQTAADDFATALILATEQFEEEDWGLLAQALRDQAEHGLEVARRKLSSQRGE